MKKRILIVTREIVMGGIERALISMLELIPEDNFEVTVMVMGVGGELREDIPDYVKIEPLYGTESSIMVKLSKAMKKGRIGHVLRMVWFTMLARLSKSNHKRELYYARREPNRKIDYDLAIAYHVPASLPVIFVAKHIKAKNKIAWIHSDVSTYDSVLDPYYRYYKRYDKIFCVSNYALQNFNARFPKLKDKTSVFYNIMDKSRMETLAQDGEGFTDSFNGIRILTVGRLSPEKGQDILPSVLFKLRSAGHNVRWYCIGDGGSYRVKIQELIKKYGMEGHFFLLGTKKNPFSYIKNCDIYVQPSVHEGYCISLAEARALRKPIVTTDFIGAKEQIRNGESGFIVKYDENDLFTAIQSLITNEQLRRKFILNLENDNTNTRHEINKLLAYLN